MATGADPPVPGFFETEAAGLRWLARRARCPCPRSSRSCRTCSCWSGSSQADRAAAAERFGRELAAPTGPGRTVRRAVARLHRRAAAGQRHGRTTTRAAWPEWFAQRRLRPYLRISADRGALGAADVALVERVLARIERYGPAAEPPSRLHGDLWPGNVLWGADGRVWLVDPAAHGGHRETDLAQLALFGGAPYLDRIVAAYEEAWPLADGWPAAGAAAPAASAARPRRAVRRRRTGPRWSARPSAVLRYGE